MATESQNELPVLSVTVLNYNYARYLDRCLRSILTQTMQEFELILINDCSTDNSREVAARYLDDPRIQFIDHRENLGYVASLIEGSNLSRGRYLTVVSADDYALEQDAFEVACRMLDTDPGIALFFSAWHQVNDRGQLQHTRRSADADYVADGAEEIRRLLLSSPILHSGAVIRRDAYRRVGGYDPVCRYSVDTNMWLALCSTGKVAYLNRALYAYCAHSSNLSKSEGALWRATEEMLLGIDSALSRFPCSALPDKAALRKQAFMRALVVQPTLDIFAGRRYRGWRSYCQSCYHYPALTVLQQRTAALVLRSLLGESLYGRVQRLGRKIGTRSSRSVKRVPS